MMEYFRYKIKIIIFCTSIQNVLKPKHFLKRYAYHRSFNRYRFRCALAAFILIFCTSCQRLDEDGGYFDEKSGIYKYVSPSRDLGKSAANVKVKSPRPEEKQQIQGVVSLIGSDLKSVWIYIQSRQIYMILAESLAKGNRSDKEKRLKLDLQYVSPNALGERTKSFRKQWRKYVRKVLEKELLKQPILADIQYNERAKKFGAIMYRVVKTKQGDRLRNINRWMIRQGLSYYIIDKGRALRDKEFSDAQNLARKNRAGIWQYN